VKMSNARLGANCAVLAGLFLLACSSTGLAEKLTPKSVPVHIRLAEAMAANEDWEEAARRWLGVLYYFGPSDQEARAQYELGRVALHRGRSDLAVAQWEKTVARHPESEWAERARKALKLLGKAPPPPPEESVEPCVTKETPAYEKQFLLANGCLSQGLYTFAIRDFLKVTNHYPDSPRAAEARFRVGTCQAMLGRPDLAIEQWERVISEYGDSPYARTARSGISVWKAILDSSGAEGEDSGDDLDSAWRPFRSAGSGVNGGLSYAEDLYENAIVEYALQEYAKVLCDIYTPNGGDNPHKDYARYRMGVCAYRLGKINAAARQWRLLLVESPESPWAQHAGRALAAVGVTDAFSSDAGLTAVVVPEALPSQLVKRYHLAALLMDCELPLVASKEYLKVIYVLTAGRPNPFQAEASYRLGECQHRRGRADLAVAAWRKTVETYAGSEWAEKAAAAIENTRRREAVLGYSHPKSEN